MSGPLPLPALLSAAFVAFTIEADNEAERAITHKTTSYGSPGGSQAVWLSSLAMWFNCLGPLADHGSSLTVAELERAARMATNVDGMRRWGYVTLDGVGRVPRGSGRRPHPRRGSRLELTARGRAAEAIWRPLPGVIEARWRERFGGPEIDRLRDALTAVDDGAGTLPDFLPIGPVSPVPAGASPGERERGLVSLLARVLMRFTLDHGQGSRVPLVAWSNLLRVLEPGGTVAVRELPALTGVARESLAVLSGRLEKAGCIAVEPSADGARGRQLRLVPPGVEAAGAAQERIHATVAEWRRAYGSAAVSALSRALQTIAGDGTPGGSPLFAGLTPPAGGWRARIDPPPRLPWHPMITHRGGYPDGA